MKKGIAILAVCIAAVMTVGGLSFIGSEFNIPSIRVETITVSSEGVVGFSGDGRSYEMESPVKSLIAPSWRYAVSGRWELRAARPVRVVSDGGVKILEIATPQGTTGQRTTAGATIKLPGGRKLVTVVWKGGEIWFLTRNTREGDLVETYEFHDAQAGEDRITIEETLPPRPW